MNSDAHKIFANYKSHLVMEAQQQPEQQEDTGVEGTSQFNENLAAIDQVEDSFNKFFETAVRTKFLTQQVATQAKQVVGQTISGFLMGLVVTSKVKDVNQLEQMKKSITSKIKGIDTSKVLAAIDQMKGNSQLTGQQPTEQQPPATPGQVAVNQAQQSVS